MIHGSLSGGVGATASAHIGTEEGAVSGGLNEDEKEEVVAEEDDEEEGGGEEEEKEEEQQHKEGCQGEEEGDGEEVVEEGRLGVMDVSAILSEYAKNPYAALFPLQ